MALAWTEVNDLSTARETGGSGRQSSSTEAIYFGGDAPPRSAATEEWSFPPPTASTLTEGDVFLSGGIDV